MKRIRSIAAALFGWVWVSAIGKMEERLADAYNWEAEETEAEMERAFDREMEREANEAKPVHAYNTRYGCGYYCGVDMAPGNLITSTMSLVTCPGCKWVLLNPAERN